MTGKTNKWGEFGMGNYSASDLRSFCERLLQNIGMSQEDAFIVSDSLIKANLEGTGSHGISRLPIYVKRFQDKRINIHPEIKIERKGTSVILVDGDNGLGHVVSYQALSKGVEIAKTNGVTAIAIKNSNHFGAASYFCQLACQHNLACIAFTNSPPGIAPWGGKQAFFGTNPIAFGFPTGNDKPVIVDLSTSIVARGKIILAAKQGNAIPDGWAIDEQGLPTNNPKEALKGSVLPMGGAKGSSLALAIEILTGVLSGAAFGPHVRNLYDEQEKNNANVGHFFILLDIEAFMELEVFFKSINTLIDEMKEVDRQPNVREIRYPGERRRRDELKHLIEGIELAENVEKELRDVANEYNTSFPYPIEVKSF
jgi:LDH2 family malate/lactate/ureidoglycolate dehydrogenase